MNPSLDLDRFVKEYSFLYSAGNKKMTLNNETYDHLKERIFKGKRNPKIVVDDKVEEIANNTIDNISEEYSNISWKHIAWKAGRLQYIEKDDNEENTNLVFIENGYAWDGLNGVGKRIVGNKDKHCFTAFINDVNSNCHDTIIHDPKLIDEKKKSAFYTEYKRLEDLLNKHEIINFGAVNIISLIYFLSKGSFPIYDRFAHIAIKALYLDANPADIYCGSAPNRNDYNMVMNMYNEYCLLLSRIFGTYSITREQDQALWVYGHNTMIYPTAGPQNYKLLSFLETKR